MAISRNQTPSRFNTAITGATRAAQVIPVHSQHTASMIAQAARVPRLAKVTPALQLNTKAGQAALASARRTGKR